MKTCTNCGKAKPLAEFNKNARSSDGYHHHCKTCIRAYYKANRDHILNKHKAARTSSTMKQCSLCQEMKDCTEFHRDNSRADGFRHYCKECGKADQQNRKTTRRVSHAPARRRAAAPVRDDQRELIQRELIQRVQERIEARKAAVARLVEVAGALIDNAEPLGNAEMVIAQEDWADLREALVLVEQLMKVEK